MQAAKGQWVQIHEVVLEPYKRAAQAPEDTQALPLEMWVKGHLLADAELNAPCTIVSPTGPHVEGILVEIEPGYSHSFGNYVAEIDAVRYQVRERLAETCPKGV